MLIADESIELSRVLQEFYRVGNLVAEYIFDIALSVRTNACQCIDGLEHIGRIPGDLRHYILHNGGGVMMWLSGHDIG